MYKVFIENRPLFFVEEKKSKQFDGFYIEASSLQLIEIDLPKIIESLPPKKEVYILCKDVQAEMERLFALHKKIDAAGGIVRRKKRLLFIKRNGLWDIPKGKIEKGESPEEAALREIEEECGIENLILERLLLITYHTYFFKGKWHLKKTYWYALSYEGEKTSTPQIEEGITEVKWFKSDSLKKIKASTFLSILDVINAYETSHN